MSETSRYRLYTLALIAVFIYGATPVFTKIATPTADGITVGALRAVVAAPETTLFRRSAALGSAPALSGRTP